MPTTASRRLCHAMVAVAVTAVTLQAAPATAVAPASPEILTPSGQSGPSVEISWIAPPDAAGYEVRVDDDPAFGSPEWTAQTPNTVAVPNRFFAIGTQHVQVRARSSVNEWGSWSTSTFDVVAPAGPELTAPEDGAELDNPDEAPLLTWTPVPGAVSYTVEIDDEAQFIGAKTYPTKANSFVVADNQAPDVDYFWRVQATLANGVLSDRSSTRTYSVRPIATPAITGPAYDEDVTDVVLDWQPVPGAKHYELQVDDDVNFGSPDATVPTKIYGTSYSPRTTFTNGQYYWRVRARDLDDNPTAWVRASSESHYFFDRVWRDQPQLVHPYDGGDGTVLQNVANDLYFEWEPVPHASNYEVWLSTDPNFTEPTSFTTQCVVAGTTYTPGVEHRDPCMPLAEGNVYHWKVRAMDRPFATRGVEGIFSTTQSFVYRDQDFIDIKVPAAGAVVGVPTIDWEPVPSTETYELTLYQDGNVQHDAITHSTSYTPLNLELDPEKGTSLRWEIRALDKDRRTSMIRGRNFTWDPSLVDTSTPLELSSGPATYDAPNLRWGAVAGAAYYRMDIADAATGSPYSDAVAPILGEPLFFPAATDTELKFLDAGTYRWWVTAYSKEGAVLDQTPAGDYGQFQVIPLGPVTGHRLALTGSALDRGDACTKTLSDGPDQLCTGVLGTPVLDWSPVKYAAEYRVRISRDPDFTNSELDPTPPHTVNTRWAPNDDYPFWALEESQANKAYYWFIQPCKSELQCGPDPKSTINPSRHAFRKASPAVSLLTPADGAVAADTEITFEWEDYLETNLKSVYAATGETGYQSAKHYRVQVSTQPTFATLLDNVLVDQPVYTAAESLYPEGPLYWRVQAVDANDNALTWSATRTLEKRSPQPRLVSPVQPPSGGLPEVTGAVPFRWEAQAFASSYEIQVAANNDTNFSSTNLKVNKTSKRPAYTTGGAGVAVLPPSETAYVWRVRRKDADGNLGPWSAIGRFKVSAAQVDLQTPAADAVVGPRGLVLRWAPIADAASYRVELRKLNSSTTTVTTPASAYAPTTALTADSVYEWRVATLDANNQLAPAGAWRRFTVGGAPKATVAASIEGSAVLGTTLTAVDPQWSVPGVSSTYEWRRNGVAIPGATSKGYVVDVADVTRQLTVVVTGTSPEFGTGVSTSAAVTGKPGSGPVAQSTPQISGSGQVGSTLTATLPQWDPAETVVTLQWKRNGTSISGATGQTYVVTPNDLNTAITLVATGTLPGRTPTASTSNTIGATQGPSATATVAPVVTGNPQVGSRLTSTVPTWNVPNVESTAVWLRNGVPIDFATGSEYVVQGADVGASLSVRWTGRSTGRADGVTVSNAVTGLAGDATPTPTPAPPPTTTPTPTPTNPSPTTPAPTGSKASTTRLKAPKKAAAGTRVTVTVTVTAANVASPTGAVKIYAGKKLVAKVSLKAGAKGVAKVRLAKLKKGPYVLRADYTGGAGVTGSSATRKLTIV
ncbi:hypothetical protein GCM10023339_76930 [Alloalcanivorax gelatiniphagus]